jgi:CTP:molybdopterin cytidylyltransferase MocA
MHARAGRPGIAASAKNAIQASVSRVMVVTAYGNRGT